MVSIEVVIPQKHHRTIMGTKGAKVQALTSEYDVQIKFPEREVPGGGGDHAAVNGEVGAGDAALEDPGQASRKDIIRITGKRDKCEAAKLALLDLVPISVEVKASILDEYELFVGPNLFTQVVQGSEISVRG